MSDELIHFLPWLRLGSASAISAADALSGAVSSQATIKAYATVGGERLEQTVRLAGPGEVTAVDAALFGRIYPEDAAKDAETAHFPLVELTEPDLPWRYTPASPKTATQQLRPWLVLVVVKQQKGVRLARESGRPAVLSIAAPADPRKELPDLADSAAWAHVQSRVAPAEASKATSPSFTARLICPRKLDANTDYIAAVVPAFEAGRCAALGLPWSAATTGPAWNLSDAALKSVELPAYLSWTFRTGAGGDFESLARRIQPISRPDPQLGRASLRVKDPSGHVPADFTTTFQGALRAPDPDNVCASPDSPSAFKTALKTWLDAGGSRPEVPLAAPAGYQPERDDPVLAPPLYGSLPTGKTAVPAETELQWMCNVNQEAHLRAAAGLGAATVRRFQEEYVAAAWEQAESARAAEKTLNAGQLAIAASRRLGRRLVGLPSGTRVQVLRPLHAFVNGQTGTVAADLRSSKLPGVLSGATTLRATRPGGVVARRWKNTTRLGEALSATLVAGTASGSTLSRALNYQVRPIPAATMVTDPTLRPVPDTMWNSVSATSTSRTSGTGGSTARTAAPATATTAVTKASPWGQLTVSANTTWAKSTSAQLGTWTTSLGTTTTSAAASLDVSGVASTLSAGIDPAPRLTSILQARIPGLSTILTRTGGLPSRLDVDLSFPDPMVWKLQSLGKRYVLPGAGEITPDSVQQLEVNNTFVAAFLLGANHEMARELIWREFPTSARRTFFRQFWDTGDDEHPDIAEISAWSKRGLPSQVTGLSAGGAALAVIGVKATLFRRFPDTRVYLAAGKWQQSGSTWKVVPDTSVVDEAVMGGSLAPDLFYYGFPVALADLRGERSKAVNTAKAGYFLVFEEPPGKPRFGIASGTAPASLTSWDGLTWSSLRGGISASFADSRVGLTNATGAVEGASWGTNAAHMARATWRRPFRLLIHGDQILPEPL